MIGTKLDADGHEVINYTVPKVAMEPPRARNGKSHADRLAAFLRLRFTEDLRSVSLVSAYYFVTALAWNVHPFLGNAGRALMILLCAIFGFIGATCGAYPSNVEHAIVM